MTKLIKAQKPRLELAHILKKHIQDYKNSYPLYYEQHRIVSDLLNCRTSKLGGHVDRCNQCGSERVIYHSCRNRHCPKCQHIPRERWLEARKSELLPVKYFHVIFTLPHELNPVILKNRSIMLNILFKSVSQTLSKFAEKELGGKPGFVAVLHTWDQKLRAHFHLHCLIAGGVVCSKTKQWIPCKDNYLFNQEALSIIFRGKFIHHLTKAIRKEKLNFAGDYPHFKEKLYKHKWVVSVREPIKKPHHVLEYLGRYTYRVAIANSRITAIQDDNVSFNYKDRKNNILKQTTITSVEFIRRFLLHTLPKGFVRIRHYGFLANRDRKANLSFIRRLLKLPPLLPKVTHSVQKMMLKLTGVDISLCPCCKKGRMKPVAIIQRSSGKHPHTFIRPPNNLAPATC